MRKNTGFTLIEMLVVVLILGILTSIALPQYQRAVKRAQGTEARVAGKAIMDAQNVYYMENKKYDQYFWLNNGGNLTVKFPAMKNFTLGTTHSAGCTTGTTCGFSLKHNVDNVFLVYKLVRGQLTDFYCTGNNCMDYFACRLIGSGGSAKCELD